MLKGAIVVFAFSLFIFGCQVKAVYPPSSETTPPSCFPRAEVEPVALPDLAISDITLDESGKVVISLSNMGKGPVPPRTGNLKVYVDDDLKETFFLGDIPDQTLLQPGGSTRHTTQVELEGTHSVKAIIDSAEEILEEDERNNLMAKVLSFERAVRLPPPPPSNLSPSKPEIPEEIPLYSDVRLTDLSLNAQRKLIVHLWNSGNAPFLLQEGTLRVFVDNVLKGSYSLGGFSEKLSLSPKEEAAFPTSMTVVGRHEIYAHLEIGLGANEINRENKALRKTLESLPIGPDIVVKELVLTEDFELSIVLSNTGEGELRKGTTLRIRIFLNDQRVSEFDHFLIEPLWPSLGNRYMVEPPSRVSISGNVRVKVVILPKQAADDIRLENNTLERDFMIIPFRIDPQTSQEFPFFLPSLRSDAYFHGNKIKTEVRWDGGGAPLRLSLKREGDLKRIARVSGKSPLKLEIPMEEEKDPKRKAWLILVTNLMEKRAEGHLIIQSP